MRVIYKNYAATTYGKSFLSVSDPDGRIIHQTDDRPAKIMSDKDLLKYLKELVKKGDTK